MGKGKIKTPAAIATLTKVLDTDTSAWVRWKAVIALGEIGIPDPTAVNLIITQTFNDSDMEVVGESGITLAKMGVKTDAAVNAMCNCALNAITPSRRGACKGLGMLGVTNELVISTLAKVCQSEMERSDVLEAASEALGILGVKNEQVLQGLFVVATCEEDSSRLVALDSLMKLRAFEEEFMTSLAEKLIGDPKRRRYIATCIGQLGVTCSKISVRALTQALKIDGDQETRLEIGRALNNILHNSNSL